MAEATKGNRAAINVLMKPTGFGDYVEVTASSGDSVSLLLLFVADVQYHQRCCKVNHRYVTYASAK